MYSGSTVQYMQYLRVHEISNKKFNLHRMKILQLLFIRCLYGSVPREYAWYGSLPWQSVSAPSGLASSSNTHANNHGSIRAVPSSSFEIEDTASESDDGSFASRGAPPTQNTMQRPGDSNAKPSTTAESIFPRILWSCVGCCLPDCVPRENTEGNSGESRRSVIPIVSEPVAKTKEHDSGEEEDIRGDGSANLLASPREPRGMQLRRRQGTSPQRPSREPNLVSYFKSLVPRTTPSMEDSTLVVSDSSFAADVQNPDIFEPAIVSPMIVQNEKVKDIYLSDVSTEAPSESSDPTTATPDSSESLSSSSNPPYLEPRLSNSDNPPQPPAAAAMTATSSFDDDFVDVADSLEGRSDEENEFVVIGDLGH